MKARDIVIAAALLTGGGAQAQTAEAPGTGLAPPAPRLEAQTERFGPLAAGFKRYSPLYGGNESANPNDRVFTGFRTDPRLVIGYALNPWLSLEAGYSHLRDEGFHKIDGGAVESAVAAGALGVKSHTTYAAFKLTLPVTERLSAYGKLGIARSVVKDDGLLPAEVVRPRSASEFVGASDTGAYGAVGAKYKLNDKTTVSGEYRVNGSAGVFSGASNASGVKGSIGIGF